MTVLKPGTPAKVVVTGEKSLKLGFPPQTTGLQHVALNNRPKIIVTIVSGLCLRVPEDGRFVSGRATFGGRIGLLMFCSWSG